MYLLHFEGDGRKVALADGTAAILGRQLTPSVGAAVSLQSCTNDNTRFHLHVRRLGPLPVEATEKHTALVVDGVVLRLGRPDKLSADGTAEGYATAYSLGAARLLGKKYRVEVGLRKHPGHRFTVRWTPAKPQYEPGEAVTLKLELKNTGGGPLYFSRGGMQRGARDSQFRFVAQAGVDGKALPDIGNLTTYCGKLLNRLLLPGESYSTDVDLSQWFTFTEPNTYRVTGTLELPVVDPSSPDIFRPVIWDDLAVGECEVRVAAK